jgi:HAMP domain-containing protein
MRLSQKLGLLGAIVALFPLAIAALIVLPQVASYSRQKEIESLQTQSRAAAALYEKRLIELRAAATGIADDIFNRALVNSEANAGNAPPAYARLQDVVSRAQTYYGLDFVIIADQQGHIIARHNDRPTAGESLLGAADKNPVADKVITGGNQPVAACVVEHGERLAQLGLDHRAQVKLENGATVDDALMIEAAAPILNGGRVLGVALIGQMFNNDFKSRPGATSLHDPLIVDIRQTLYRNTETDAGVLVSCGNAVIASSILPGSGNASIEAPLAGVVRDTGRETESLEQGGLGYLVAWQALKSLDGAEVGALGVAQSAGAAGQHRRSVRTTFILVALLALVVAGAGGFLIGRALGVRLDDLNDAAQRWSVGELSTPARDRDPMMARWIPAFMSQDEVSRLAAQLEQMRESFRQAIERLRKR